MVSSHFSFAAQSLVVKSGIFRYTSRRNLVLTRRSRTEKFNFSQNLLFCHYWEFHCEVTIPSKKTIDTILITKKALLKSYFLGDSPHPLKTKRIFSHQRIAYKSTTVWWKCFQFKRYKQVNGSAIHNWQAENRTNVGSERSSFFFFFLALFFSK